MTYNWNRLDFFVIVITIVDVWNRISFFVNDTLVEELDFFNYLKLLRNLRTLRLLSKNDNMRKIIGSLIDSLNSILKVIGIVCIVFVMFSVIGITLFYKQYNTCYVANSNDVYYPVKNFSGILLENKINKALQLSFVSKNLKYSVKTNLME